MKKLHHYRKRLDKLDLKIMNLLDERFDITNEIGLYKFEHQLEIENKAREEEIYKKCNLYDYEHHLKEVYQKIIKTSKDAQDYGYFLVGKNLTHSLSPQIYQSLGLNYQLYPTDDFLKLKKLSFKGFNITNPYKDEAYNMCDFLSDEAKRTHSVNTILKKDDGFHGFNTDVFGICQLIDHYKLDINNSKVIIIGNGATSRTIHEALKSYQAKKIVHLVRTIRRENEFSLSLYQNFSDYDYIFNATSYGTYPAHDIEPLFSLGEFTDLKAVVDVVYNPLLSPLLYEAKKHKIKAINGLYMLVSQAVKAYELYTNQKRYQLIDSIYLNLKKKLTNIVLIGMPYSGKSTLGKTLADLLQKRYLDIDHELKKLAWDLATVLKTKDILQFRDKEQQVTIDYAIKTNQVIATGGGVILRDETMRFLKNNGIIIFIDPPLSILKSRIDDTRPLVKSEQDLEDLYNNRIDLYRRYADIIIEKSEINEELLEKINEIVSD